MKTLQLILGGLMLSFSLYAQEPTTQSSLVATSAVSNTTATLNWTIGNGTNRIVVIKAGAPVDAFPVDATTYTASATFGSGTQLGTGNYVVYAAGGASVAITGLTLATVYHVQVFEYNGGPGTEDYLLAAAASNPISFKTTPTVITTDSLALVALYNSTNGAAWTNSTNWLTGPVNTWYGITIGANRVSNISLLTNNLNGPVPLEIGNLTGLTNLELGGNNLTGAIPIQIGTLSNLTYLNFGGNSLTGIIPNEIGSLAALVYLGMAYNALSGAAPTTLASLANLQTLEINNNNIVDLPDLTALTNLTLLDITNNLFTFEDIVPNVGIPGIVYDPQNSFGLSNKKVFLKPGETLTYSITTQNYAGNTFQWQKNNSNLAGQISNTLNVPNVTVADEGQYALGVTNPATPGFFIYSNPITMTLKQESLFEWADGGALTSEGYDSTGSGIFAYGGQWGDFNNDGYEDVFVTGSSQTNRSHLFKNNKDGTFSLIPDSAYFYASGRSATWADYNNDGWLDCFAPAYFVNPDSTASPSIFKNNRDETFTKIPLPEINAAAAVWADTDGDGDLDLMYSDGGAGFISLYRNDGADTFTLVPNTFASTTTWNPVTVDVNNDNIMDLYVPQGATTSTSNTRALYIGNGDNTFTPELASPLVSDPLGSDRGASWADIDNDGDYDAYVMTNGTENIFYINDGAGNFVSQTSTTILGEIVRNGRGSAFSDFNNDGYVDLLTISQIGPVISWLLFQNDGDGTFTKVLNQNFKTGAGFVGASFGDYDNDGFVDIVSASAGQENNGLYRNKGNSNNWLQLKLIGNLSNKNAIGAKVDVYSPGNKRTHQQIITNNGAHNQNSLTAQIGLGTNTAIDSVIINWPSGLQQKVTGLAVNRVWKIKENNFEIDSLALVAFYNATGGPNWTNKTNWLTGPVTTWFGVTFTSGNVTAIGLPNNNLVGPAPEELANLIKLQTLDLSDNKITSIPDLTSLPDLISANVSGNKLNFASLEINGLLSSINFGNQAVLGDTATILVDVGLNHIVFTNGGGAFDRYQWKRNNEVVAGATQKSYTIIAINRNNMGEYFCEITNPSVPGLLLTTGVQTVWATATLTGRLLVTPTEGAQLGDMTLFKIQTGAYDTTRVTPVNPDGTYSMQKVILDDYSLVGFADTLLHKGALPTYFVKTIFWEEADTLVVDDNFPALDILSEFRPAPPSTGVGIISGLFSEDIPDDPGGKTLRNKRVSKAGCSLRRVERTGRGQDVILTLIAVTFTNEEGEFEFDKLDPGEYLLNLQYPGYPMDTTSFINIIIGTGLFDRQAAVDANVIDGKIVVTKRVITGVEDADTAFIVYPNPSHGAVRIKSRTGNHGPLDIAVSDTQGKSMNVPREWDESTESWLLDVKNLFEGTYLIKLVATDRSYTFKLVVRH